MKRCTQCKIEKPIDEFHYDKSRYDGRSNRCKDCRCRLPKIFFKNCLGCGDVFEVSGNRKAQKYCGEKCATTHRKYGIDEYKYEDYLISQNYKCAICKQEEKAIDIRTGQIYELAVDHCHKTGKVRGLLCSSCNQGLGMFKDNIEYLREAIEYLKNNGLNSVIYDREKKRQPTTDC